MSAHFGFKFLGHLRWEEDVNQYSNDSERILRIFVNCVCVISVAISWPSALGRRCNEYTITSERLIRNLSDLMQPYFSNFCVTCFGKAV